MCSISGWGYIPNSVRCKCFPRDAADIVHRRSEWAERRLSVVAVRIEQAAVERTAWVGAEHTVIAVLGLAGRDCKPID